MKYSKENIIEAIQRFYKENDKVPTSKDFTNTKSKYPSYQTVTNYFGSWNNAIEAAGFFTTHTKNTIIEAIQQFHKENGSIPRYKDFENNAKYPGRTTVITNFGTWNKATEAAGFTPEFTQGKSYKNCSKKGCIKAIQRFYKEEGKIPQYRDFIKNTNYPSHTTVRKYFGTWNKAIKTAGFVPNIQNGFGTDTYGLDGVLYRSKAEAYFCNNFLYKKYNYIVEPKYPDSLWMYDWYISSLNLYIELDGELRPKRTLEKIEVNKQLNRNCLFIKTKDIYNKEKLEDFV